MVAFLVRIGGLIKKILTKKKQVNPIAPETESIYTKDIYINTSYCIGEYTYGHPKILHWGENANLIIGKFCSIADNVTIFLGGNHRTDWITTYPFNRIEDFSSAKDIEGHPATKGDVIIGNDVWIGSGVTILSGITIGDGAVIGAQSVVTKNVEPYTIVAGNPATIIRQRFTDKEILQLQEIQWWNWPLEEIKRSIHSLCTSHLDDFLKDNLDNIRDEQSTEKNQENH